MKRVLVALVTGTILSGTAAVFATTTQRIADVSDAKAVALAASERALAGKVGVR